MEVSIRNQLQNGLMNHKPSNEMYNLMLIGDISLILQFIKYSMLVFQPLQRQDYITQSLVKIQENGYGIIILNNNILVNVIPQFTLGEPGTKLFLEKVLRGNNIKNQYPVRNKHINSNLLVNFLSKPIDENFKPDQVLILANEKYLNVSNVSNVLNDYLILFVKILGTYPTILYDTIDITLFKSNNIMCYEFIIQESCDYYIDRVLTILHNLIIKN